MNPEIDAHRAESDRLARLAEFLAKFAPAIGEARQPGRPAAEAGATAEARDRAVVAAFDAIGRIARNSFNFPQAEGPDR